MDRFSVRLNVPAAHLGNILAQAQKLQGLAVEEVHLIAQTPPAQAAPRAPAKPKKQRKWSGRPHGSCYKLVEELISKVPAGQDMVPRQFYPEAEAKGHSKSGVTSSLHKMVDQGKLMKVSTGVYRRPARPEIDTGAYRPLHANQSSDFNDALERLKS